MQLVKINTVKTLDAVVIGLGPSGSAALRRLHELGVEAVGLERKVAPENPVVCGEYLPDKDEVRFISKKPSVKKAYEYIEMAKKQNSLSTIEILFKGGKRFLLKIQGFTVDRRELVTKMIEGLEYYAANTVVGIKRIGNEYIVRTNKGIELKAKNIVAADGYPSLTRRILGSEHLLKPKDVALGLNARIALQDVDNSKVYMYASPRTEGGYAWIIPFRGNVANVGIGIRYNYIKSGVNITQRFNQFLAEDPWGVFSGSRLLEKPKSRWIPVSGFYGEPVNEHVYYVGDSLGAVNPINGGGIFTAMALGILAAEAIWLENPKIYVERSWNEIGEILRIGREYRKIVDFLYDHWRLVKPLTLLVPSSLMKKILKGEKTLLYDFLRV